MRSVRALAVFFLFLVAAMAAAQPAPSVFEVNLNRIPANGNTFVFIGGANFVPGATVFLGSVAVTNAYVDSPNVMSMQPPPVLPAGTYEVTVQNPDGQTSAPAGVTLTYDDAPIVRSMTPSGLTTGGDTFWINGFFTDPIVGVTIGGQPAQLTFIDPAFVLGIVPPHPTPEFVDVEVTNASGFTTTLTGAFRYMCPLPQPQLIAPASICPYSSGNVVSIANPDPALTYVWQVFNGAITSSTTGTQITFDAGGPAVVGISVSATTECGYTQTDLPILVDETSPPAPPIVAAPPQVCPGSTGNAASIANPDSGATYVWQIINGTITSQATGTQITFNAGALGAVTLNVTATNHCYSSPSPPAFIPIDAPLVSPITLSAPVCSASAGNTASVQPRPGTFAWTITGGTITSGANTNVITFTADSSGTVTLSVTLTTTCASASRSLQATIDPPVSTTMTVRSGGRLLGPNPAVCTNDTVDVFVADAGIGAIYDWSVVNGTLVFSNGRNAVFTAGPNGPMEITAAVTNRCGRSATATRSVAVNVPPEIIFGGLATACASSPGNFLEVVNVLPNETFQWSIDNGVIDSPDNGPTISYTAGASGVVTLAVAATHCGLSTTATKTIAIGAPPDATFDIMRFPSMVPVAQLCNTGSYRAALRNFGPGATVHWSVTNGAITSNPTGPSVLFVAGSSGATTITVTVTQCGLPSTNSMTLPIGAHAAITQTADGSSITLTASPGASYLWSNGATTQSISVSSAGTYSVTVTSAAGCSATSASANVEFTATGSNVTTSAGGVTATFDGVSVAGVTSVTPIAPSSAGSLPGGFALTAFDVAYEISTTSQFSPPVIVGMQLTAAQLATLDEAAFNSLRILHNESGALVDRTILPPDSPAPDFAAGRLYARVSTLSPFVLAMSLVPTITTVAGPTSPIALGSPATISAQFTDANRRSHSATIDWGDGTTTAAAATESNGYGDISASHSYGAAGVFGVTVTVANDEGFAASELFQYVVVYDAGAGSVTGGGTFESNGKATFGFTVRYERGAAEPSGSTQMKAGALDLHATKYDWLVISGSRAQFRGSARVNGGGDYAFLFTVVDGSPDRLRVKIWDKTTGDVVYDTQGGASDAADPATVVDRGSIVIHP